MSMSMGVAEKHLRELLKEDQEPFLLKHYISERRSHLRSKNSDMGFNECLPTTTTTTTPLRPSSALLQAALRIQKPKPNTSRAFRLGLFASLFKKLTARKVDRSSSEPGLTTSTSSSVCSETNHSEASTSHHSLQHIHFLHKPKQNDVSFHHHAFFCHTPRHAPPTPHRPQDKEMNGADGINKFQSGEEEEDKEQCSPVSVLDPPFDDDDDDDGHENDHGEDGFDLDCGYANVQRTKLQLLDRLQRFEKLAELDPIELEKRMLDQEEEYETFIEDETCEEKALREKVFEILCHARVNDMHQTPEDLKRLVYDLIMEEETQVNSSEERNMVIRRVCRRLELWNEVKSNTIDMMIEEDFSREEGMWKKNADQTRDLALELEHAIFGFLVEELVC